MDNIDFIKSLKDEELDLLQERLDDRAKHYEEIEIADIEERARAEHSQYHCCMCDSHLTARERTKGKCDKCGCRYDR